jgi:DNA-binding CsgD family transcriptional regulator
MSVLAGRRIELAAIDAALADARAGHGALIVLSGEPGIGKSRLAQEAISKAQALGMSTARGYALDDPGAPPLWPWRRAGRDIGALGQALDASDDIGTDAVARFGLFESVAAALTGAAAGSGLAVVLEDLHWADPPTIALVLHVTADLATAPILLVVTARAHRSGPAWSTAFPELLRRAGTRSLVLSGLSESAIAQWLRSNPDRAEWAPFAEQLCLRSNGNPLYLSLLTADPPGPDGRRALDLVVASRPDLRAVVMANVAGLSAPCRRILEAAALLGEQLSPRLLALVTNLAERETSVRLAEAISAGVLLDTDTVPSFAHALIRDSVAAGIPLDLRADLHRAIALALERDPVEAPAGSIAEHWRLAAGPDAASHCVFWARRAAGLAAAGFAHETAVAYAELALRQAQLLARPAGELAELTVELAERQMAAGDLQSSVDSCQAAADLADRSGRTDLLAKAALVINGVGDVGAFRVVSGLNNRALAALPSAEGVLRARLLAQQAIAAAETGGGRRAAELAAEAVAAAEKSGDRTAELEALAARHLSITVPEAVDEREQIARRAILLGRTANDSMPALWGHLWLIDVYFQRGELDRIDEELGEIDMIAVRRRFPLARWHGQRIRAALAALQGDFELAYRINDETLVLANRMNDISMVGVTHALAILLAAIRGDPGRLEPETLETIRNAPPLPLIRALLAVLLLLVDERVEAAGILDELRFLIDELPAGPRWAGTLAIIGLAATLLDDVDSAERVYRQLLPSAGDYDGDGSGTIFTTGSNARAVGEFALTAGRVDEAVGLFADAVIANRRLGARPFVALSRLGWARALRRRATDPGMAAIRSPGDLRLAADLARQAAAEFRRLDMPGPLRTADGLLIQLAADGRRQNPLTSRESEIAALIAEEQSNREIATRLVVSERTVESHVRNILAKLDLASRMEIARWTRRQ